MKKKLLFIPLFGMLLAGCFFEDLMFWKKKDDKQQTPVSSEEKRDEYTAIIETSGSKFEEAFTTRTQFVDETSSGKLKDYFVKFINDDSYITSVSCKSSQSIDYKDTRLLQIGSSSNTGSIEIVSETALIKSVEVIALSYAKYDDTNKIWRVDAESHFVIDEVDETLDVDAEGMPTEKVVRSEYVDGTSRIVLSQHSGRVFVKQIQITWESK